ncbi:MAG: DUF4167 domain-containing protein [Rhizobiaceae bacterium]|nr:DUF4167 domain-containing protein [Rhizobiaceae bacterium]
MRGRNNNNNNNNNSNRKGPNPLTRNYESNGPDVKIRGSAQQIAEKYATLARDAMSSGDRVMAENYLQHAEHYNRIIAAAQAQMPIQNFQPQQRGDDFDDDFDDESDGTSPAQGSDQQPQYAQQGASANPGDAPQPVIEGTPAEVALTQEGAQGGERQPRQNGYQNGNSGEGDDYQRRGRRRRGRGRFGDEERGERGAQAGVGGEQAARGAEQQGGEGAPVPHERPAPESADVDSVT